MKILVIHNQYQILGGEDSVVKNETGMLRKAGVDVELLLLNNAAINSLKSKFLSSLQVVYSFSSNNRVKQKLFEFNPDIVHVHNYFPLISPSVFYLCQKLGFPVVHTLHNFRPICPTALLMHRGEITNRSITSGAWWALKYRVYRGSFIGTLLLVLMIETHKKMGTWTSKVDRFIALTSFSKDKYLTAGWPSNKVVVKPNFRSDPLFELDNKHESVPFPLDGTMKYMLFVGRISEEKGIRFLLEAWKELGYTLFVVGDGPLKDWLVNNKPKNVEYLGRKTSQEVMYLMKHAVGLVMTSNWYEGFPMVIVESLSLGLPLVVPDLGGMKEIVKDGVTGFHFNHGSISSFVDKVLNIMDQPTLRHQLSVNARADFEANYSEASNLSMLMSIYHDVLRDRLER